MSTARLENAIYKIIIDELEPRENRGMLKGNAHHIAQQLTADILKKIKEKEPKRKKRNTTSNKSSATPSCIKCKHRINYCLGCLSRDHINFESERASRTFIACYKNRDRWMLITREIATLAHANKKSESYKKAGYLVKILPLDL